MRTLHQWIAVGVVLIASGAVGPARAYDDVITHPQLTLHSTELFRNWPEYVELRLYRNVLSAAVLAEDEDARFLNHFYDPDTGNGLEDNFENKRFIKFYLEHVLDHAKELPGQRHSDLYYTNAL